MFTHIVVGSNDIARSKKFYDAIFEAMDIPPSEVHANGRLIYAKHGQRFVVTKPIDGKPATPPMAAPLGWKPPQQPWPMHGTRLALPMADRPLKTRPASARPPWARCIWPICVTRMATSCALAARFRPKAWHVVFYPWRNTLPPGDARTKKAAFRFAGRSFFVPDV